MKTLHYLLVTFIVAIIISLVMSIIIYILYVGYKLLDTNLVLGAFIIILPVAFIISIFGFGDDL